MVPVTGPVKGGDTRANSFVINQVHINCTALITCILPLFAQEKQCCEKHSTRQKTDGILPDMLLHHSEPSEELERILKSDTFRTSAALRRLLRFLFDKAVAGEADQLKEYSIGVDAFGKPTSYDPRNDAIVRLQVGRLRQKLGEYYRTEGECDPLVFDLPKGRFKLKWEIRTNTTEEDNEVEAIAAPAAPPRWRSATLALSVALFVVGIWGIYSAITLWRVHISSQAFWSPELEQLWSPFLTSRRPLVVAVADPLFIELQGTDIFFRQISVRRPEDATGSSALTALRKFLGNPEMEPAYSYMPTGEVMSSFLIAKLLGSRRQDIRLVRSSQLPLEELGDDNVILIGPEVVIDRKLPGIQLKPELLQTPDGIRNLHPRPGEPAFFADRRFGSAANDGEAYALVSHAPGPLANTVIQTFSSSRTWGREGAVQAFTDTALARTLAKRLRTASGQIPRFYQIVLRVKFTDGIPTDVSYVLHRDLTPK